MSRFFRSWSTTNRSIIANTSALIGTTAVNTGLGFVYWWLAARRFPAAEVGLASTAIAAIGLIGTIGALGLGTLLLGELPRQRERAASLTSAALLVTGAVGALLGIVFALCAPLLSAELRPFASSSGLLLLALGAGLTAVTMVLDQALIGLLRGGWQFWRNALFSGTKLLALLGLAFALPRSGGLAVFGTWVFGFVVSLTVLGARARGSLGPSFPPHWRLLRGLGPSALRHHLLNLVLLVPSLTIPLVVTTMLSTTTTAYFNIAWLLAGMVSVAPVAATTVLYAVGSAEPEALGRKVRFTLGLASGSAIAAYLVVLFGAEFGLRVFGTAYAQQSAAPLRILGFGVFPLIVREHYVTICRVQQRTTAATALIAVSSIGKLLGAALGAALGGLPGLCAGLTGAECLAALLMAPVVGRAATSGWQRGDKQPVSLIP